MPPSGRCHRGCRACAATALTTCRNWRRSSNAPVARPNLSSPIAAAQTSRLRRRSHSANVECGDLYLEIGLVTQRCCAFIATVLLICLIETAHGQSLDRPPDTMAERVLACAPCHGAQGEGTKDPYFPRLAGKPAGYLFNQLVAFQNGRRQYPPMNYLLAYLPESYLKEIAEHMASLNPPPPSPVTPTVAQGVLAMGQSLVTHGDASRSIPACMSCHGPNLAGMEPGIPGLLGLRPSYISAQLGGWRYGTRTALAPDCMQAVAALLTEADVTAIAAWLSSQPAAPDRLPAARGSYALPLACGSQPQ
jgi:cytochrome c553